jgi:hypothetical protein
MKRSGDRDRKRIEISGITIPMHQNKAKRSVGCKEYLCPVIGGVLPHHQYESEFENFLNEANKTRSDFRFYEGVKEALKL